MKYLFALCTLIFFSTCNFAQNNEQMEVIKDYKADIPETPRFEIGPNYLPVDNSPRKQQYNLLLRPYEVSYLTPNIKPLRMVSEENLDASPGFISLALGHPLNRNLKGHYAFTPNPQSIVSLDLDHFGMNKGAIREHQQFSNSVGKFRADVFTKAGYTISGDIRYGQLNRYFYGYNRFNEEKNKTYTFLTEDVRRQFYDFGGKFSIFNHLPTIGKFDYRAEVETYSFFDNLKNRELGMVAQIGLGYQISENGALSVKMLTDVTKYSFDSDTTQSLNHFLISPSYSFHNRQFHILVGGTFGLNNGKAVLLPNLETGYQLLSDKLSVFLGAKGTIERQNFRVLALENPYIINNITIKNANNTEIYTGLKGQNGAFSFRLDGSYRKVDHLPLYLAKVDSIPRFKVLYDTARIISFGGEFSYSIKESINLRAALKQRFYQLNRELKAWHLPSFTAMIGIGYTKNKFNFNLDINTENGVPYLDAEGPSTLEPLIEINLGSRYSITPKIEAFIQLNNLANNKRQRWQYYENIGFNFLGGVVFRF